MARPVGRWMTRLGVMGLGFIAQLESEMVFGR